jgi:hypothetical protein
VGLDGAEPEGAAKGDKRRFGSRSVAQGNYDDGGVNCPAIADGNENTFEPLVVWSARIKNDAALVNTKNRPRIDPESGLFGDRCVVVNVGVRFGVSFGAVHTPGK